VTGIKKYDFEISHLLNLKKTRPRPNDRGANLEHIGPDG
jgi:hypothetical protein